MDEITPAVAAPDSTPEGTADLDVLIVGAGLSGIGVAHHLRTAFPGKRLLILEGRERIGGTWDLFRYPGVRSDSDMYTLGYSFRPWRERKAIADGPSILSYIEDTAREGGIEPLIRLGHQVRSAAWCSRKSHWTVTADVAGTGTSEQFTCRWLHMATGYYHYAEPHRPDFPGSEQFRGRIVDPQFWPDDLDHRDKQVIVIGSGATAVTIVPEMAKAARHVMMLQRSPTYMVSAPSEDAIAGAIHRLFPSSLAYRLARWKNVLLQMIFFRLSRRRPAQVARRLIGLVRKQLPAGYDLETHFTPDYKPWDQRLCLVPDGDLFAAISEGRASIATGTIETFTPGGIRLASGEEISADIIVTATGLKVQLFSDIRFTIDGTVRSLADEFAYKGMMFSDVPNFSYTFGYTNASWTLKADLSAGYLCRLLNHMEEGGFAVAVPRREPDLQEVPFIDFTSGYVERARYLLPKQASRQPWRVHQNYIKDIAALRWGRLEDGVMTFGRSG